MYRTGYSVVRRRTDRSVKRTDVRAAKGAVWTLHKDGCNFLGRARESVPAPLENYPGTVPCVYCKPSLEEEGAA